MDFWQIFIWICRRIHLSNECCCSSRHILNAKRIKLLLGLTWVVFDQYWDFVFANAITRVFDRIVPYFGWCFCRNAKIRAVLMCLLRSLQIPIIRFNFKIFYVALRIRMRILFLETRPIWRDTWKNLKWLLRYCILSIYFMRSVNWHNSDAKTWKCYVSTLPIRWLELAIIEQDEIHLKSVVKSFRTQKEIAKLLRLIAQFHIRNLQLGLEHCTLLNNSVKNHTWQQKLIYMRT